MPVGSVATAVPPQITAALAAIASTQSAELAVATQLEQGIQPATVPGIPNLGQTVDLTV